MRAVRAPLRAGRRTNLALFGLLTIAFASGVLAFAVGGLRPARVIALSHGIVGLALVLLVPWKSAIVRRSRHRTAARSALPGALLGLLLAVSVLAGLAHALGGYYAVLGITPLAVHVGAAVLAVPLLVMHVRRRRQRPRLADLSRRTVLRAGVLGIASASAYATLAGVAVALDLPGAARRATGSHEAGSGTPDRMPVTQWFTDAVPDVDPQRWQVAIGSRLRQYAEISAGTDAVRAVLDCTAGWYAEQTWRGVRLDRLVKPRDRRVRSIDVVSVTGYRRRFPVHDLDRLLLVTHVAGTELSVGHGGPVRLVAPGRRGFWWVKWVSRIEPTDEPWWLQPPFPLQ